MSIFLQRKNTNFIATLNYNLRLNQSSTDCSMREGPVKNSSLDSNIPSLLAKDHLHQGDPWDDAAAYSLNPRAWH